MGRGVKERSYVSACDSFNVVKHVSHWIKAGKKIKSFEFILEQMGIFVVVH
jgi:hypothetical protein